MLPLPLSFPVMEASTVPTLPLGPGWQYEPKWDGFRCVAFRDGHHLDLVAKNGRPLTTAFPEVAADLQAIAARRFVLDGELVVPVGDHLSFDDLIQRLHPAAAQLARERPAVFVIFDMLVDEGGESQVDRTLAERREAMTGFARQHLSGHSRLRLSPATTSALRVQQWATARGGFCDGVVAKRTEADYRSGLRDGMVKVKPVRTVDCVIGGFIPASGSTRVDRLLLGLFDDDGLLHHVGDTRPIAGHDLPLRCGGIGFDGRPPPGMPHAGQGWIAVDPELVVEVRYDQVAHEHFRHATRLVRCRVDKDPRHCHLEQLDPPSSALPALLRRPVRSPVA